MSLVELASRARVVKAHNVELQLRHANRPWSTVETMLGFVTDVGDLARLVMMNSQLRPATEEIAQKIRHELGDCLWAILTLADELEVDLESSFLETLETIMKRSH